MTELIIVTVYKGGHLLDVTIRDHGCGDADIGAGRWELVSIKLGEYDLTALLSAEDADMDIFEEACCAAADAMEEA